MIDSVSAFDSVVPELMLVETAQAWLVPISPDHQFAVAAYEFKEILQQPKLIKVPLAPEHCQYLLIRDEQAIPVIDLNLLILGKKTQVQQDLKIGILAYQTAPETPIRYCAIYLFAAPEKIEVSNAQAKLLPPQSSQQASQQSIWQPFAISSFEHNNQVIPIVRPQDFVVNSGLVVQ